MVYWLAAPIENKRLIGFVSQKHPLLASFSFRRRVFPLARTALPSVSMIDGKNEHQRIIPRIPREPQAVYIETENTLENKIKAAAERTG